MATCCAGSRRLSGPIALVIVCFQLLSLGTHQTCANQTGTKVPQATAPEIVRRLTSLSAEEDAMASDVDDTDGAKLKTSWTSSSTVNPPPSVSQITIDRSGKLPLPTSPDPTLSADYDEDEKMAKLISPASTHSVARNQNEGYSDTTFHSSPIVTTPKDQSSTEHKSFETSSAQNMISSVSTTQSSVSGATNLIPSVSSSALPISSSVPSSATNSSSTAVTTSPRRQATTSTTTSTTATTPTAASLTTPVIDSSTAHGTATDIPTAMQATGDPCGPHFSFSFTFSQKQPLVDYCHMTFTHANDSLPANSSQSCLTVNVTGLQLGTDYVANVVTFHSDHKSLPVFFNISIPADGIYPREVHTHNLTHTTATLSWKPEDRRQRAHHVFHVQLREKGLDSTCVNFTVSSNSSAGSASSLPDTDVHDRHKRDATCRTETATSATSDSVVIGDLRPCTTYDVTVTPYCQCHCDQPVLTTSFTTLSAPPILDQIHVSSDSPGLVTVRWTGLTAQTGCGPVNYRLMLLDVDNNDTVVKQDIVSYTFEELTQGQHNFSHNFTDLLSNHRYKVQIVAASNGGTSPLSSSGVVQTPKSPPGQVVSAHVCDNTDTDGRSAKVCWQPPRFNNGHLQMYVIRVFSLSHDCVNMTRFVQVKGSDEKDHGDDRENERSYNGSCKDPVTSYGNLTLPQLIISNLLPDTTYNLSITAVNDIGFGPPKFCLIHTAVAVPSSPTNLKVTDVTATTVVLSWTPPKPHPGPTFYDVTVLDLGSPYQDPPPDVSATSQVCPGGYSTSSCKVEHLRPYWRYNLTLTAQTVKGHSPPVTDTVVTQTTASGPVKDLHVQSLSGNYTAVRLLWACPDLEHRNDLITGFWVRSMQQEDADRFQVSEVDHVLNKNCNSNHSTVVRVTPEQEYVFQVLTVGSHRNATEWTNTSLYSAPSGKSEAVSSLSVTSPTATEVSLSWTRPTVTNGHLTAYGLLVEDSQHACIRWTVITFDGVNLTEMVDGPDRGINCLKPEIDTVTVAPDNDRYNLTVTDLPPDTNLNITVYPQNGAGWGHPRAVTDHTMVAVPSAPRHPHVEVMNASSLSVSWEPPQPRPGPTTYTLRVMRAANLTKGPSFQKARVINVTGWNNTEVLVEGLRSGWSYVLSLTASTAAGSKPVQIDPLVTMPESPPGQVQNLSVTSVPHNYRKLQVTWQYPAMIERHGCIRNFTIRIQNHGTPSIQCNVTECLCPQGTPGFCLTLDATPGVQYTVIVRANNEFSGMASRYTYKAEIGPPPPIAVPPETPPSASSSQSTFSVSYCAPCLLNSTNGEIVYFALIVCDAHFCSQMNTSKLNSQQTIEDLPSWHHAKGDDFRGPYRPTDGAWRNTVRASLARTKRSTVTQGPHEAAAVYVVGDDDQCPSKPSPVHCNGPLPPGRSFRVLSVSCTVTSCSASALSQPMVTLAATEDSTFPALIIIGSLMGVAAAVVVVLVAIWCRRRRAFKRCRREEDEEGEMTDMTLKRRQVSMQDYEDVLRAWKAGPRAESGLPLALVEQFAELRTMSPRHSTQAATMDENKVKNRYINILPFDHSRVKLIQLDDDVTSDYINANYIAGYHSKREYIATQGPLEATADDFWRMVWEQKSPVIVMLSGLKEGRLNKVYKYYPDKDEMHQARHYDMVTVTLEGLQKRSDYLVRTFKLSVGRNQRVVQQFYIDNWKDFDANLNANLVLEFVRAVREAVPVGNKHPIVVHCSAGVGRTGTWIAIDYFMHYIRHHPTSAPLNIFDVVLVMRDCRVNMVQAPEQFVFIHDVVAEIVRRKTEADRYDEPVYSTGTAYVNGGYDTENADDVYDSSSEPSSSAGVRAVKHPPTSSSTQSSVRSTKSETPSREIETSRM